MRKIATMVTLCLVAVAMVGMMVAAQDRQDSQNIKCTLNSIAEDSKTMKVTDASDQSLTMNLSKTTKVQIDGEAGKLTDLKKGDRLQCICQKTETANTYNCSEIRRNKSDQK